jgi:20S proteasome alpha/beta subunit
MTTIATDGLTLAADTQQNGQYIDRVSARKLYRLQDGSLAGGAGLVASVRKIIRYLDGLDGLEKHAPDIDDDTCVLLLAPDGRVYYYDRRLEPVEIGAPAAIGSGAPFAMGAMLAGAAAPRAVEIAIELDTDSGGVVTVEALGKAST